ncbi:amidase [Auricularia subglabra TFB-10046 SS5]|nr:amidase [Auricularia subglabra TFB-10046 SS5]
MNALGTANAYSAEEHAGYLRAAASEIVSRISAREWKAEVVLEAYIARAVDAHGATNAITEVMFDEARERARRLDAEFAKTGQVVGPLHGVPMTVKDTFDVTGYDTTLGFTRWIGNPAAKNANAVDLLLDAGAVIFAKTNVPQTLLSFECCNPLWGRTTNPYSDKYTSGGSSGGEAVLLAMNGSTLGLGTDIGGSLRLPAAFSGVYSLKPCHGRVAYGGAKSSFGGMESVRTVAGPMGRTVDDLILLSRILFGRPSVDRDVVPLPFRDVALPAKLKFGYYVDDGFVKASPACVRAITRTVDALRSVGHECVELEWPFNSEPAQLFSALTCADGYHTLFSPVGPDPVEDSVSVLRMLPKLPGVVRSALAWIVASVLGDAHFAQFIRGGRTRSVFELYQLVDRRDEFSHRLHIEIFDALGLDAIISPVLALPGVQHHAAKDIASLSIPCMIYNLADCPAGVVPVTRVDAKLDALPDGYWSTGTGSKLLGKACTQLYDAKKMEGLPVSIQIAGRKWEDEKVLAMMRAVDDALGKRGFSPQEGKFSD